MTYMEPTFGDLHLSDGLPFVHSNKPSFTSPPTAQINDKFTVIPI